MTIAWYLFGIRTYPLTDIGTQFVSKFRSVSRQLEIGHLTNLSYHAKNNGKAESIYRTIVTSLSHYAVERQIN